MKLSANTYDMAKAAKAVAKFLPRNAVLTAQNSILVEAEGDQVAMTATDIESGRRIEVDASVQDEGRILVPSDLVGVLAGAGGERVEITADDHQVSVRDASASWTLRLNNIDDYPKLAHQKLDGSVSIEDWGHIRAVASFAQPRSGNRPACQGVVFENGGAVATDTYQAAYTPLGTEGEDHPPANVPAHAIAALDASVSELRIGARMVEATLDDGRFWTRLIDGSFPRVKKLIDDQPPPSTVIELDSDEIADVLRRATLVGNADAPVWLNVDSSFIRLTRRFGDDDIFSENIMGGVRERDEDISAVAINPTYFRNLIAPVSRIRLSITGPYALIGFSGIGDKDAWWTGAVMPVRAGSS